MLDVDIVAKNYRGYSDETPLRICIRDGFTAIIGANNAGKSSVLNLLYDFRSWFSSLGDTESALEMVRRPQEAPSFFSSPTKNEGLSSSTKPDGIFYNRNDRPLSVGIEVRTEQTDEATPKKLVISRSRDGKTTCELPDIKHPIRPSKPVALAQGDDPGKALDLSLISDACRSLSDTFYIPAWRNILHEVTLSAQNLKDVKIGLPFISEWKHKKMGQNSEDRELAYKVTNQIKDLFGFQEFSIDPGEPHLYVQIDGKNYDATNQGAGLSQFIHTLASAAFRKPDFILIDEPEMSLHPALQLMFLEALGSHAKRGVIFATHSIGLARSAAEYIYSVRKVGGGRSIAPLENTRRLAELLGELNYSAHRELGFDNVLLVEGPTEVKTIQQILRKFRKDQNVLLLPLGGSAMICGGREAELDEIRRITPHISALIDSDWEAAGQPLANDRKAFVESCRSLNIPCHVTDRRATENYFTESAVKTVKGAKCRPLGNDERLSDLQYGWAKADNWLIAAEMTADEWFANDIGRFLKSL